MGAILHRYDTGVHSVHIFLLHKSNADETQILKQLTNDYCIRSPPYISSDRIKKLDEDVHRIKNQCKLFLSTASKVLTQWLTWRGRTLTFLGM